MTNPAVAVPLPMSDLADGGYLLTVEALQGGRSVRRALPFAVGEQGSAARR